MIKVDKGKAPDYLLSEKVEIAYERMQKFYTSLGREQKRYTFPFNKEIDANLKEELHKIFHGKCGYCEVGIPSSEYGIIDRFRPHNGVRDKNEYNQDLYWWLTFDWDNLIYSCKECNQYKANYFPITKKRVSKENDDINLEGRLLLNPCIDNPQEHFYYDNDGYIQIKTNEGEQTVELLRLNDRTSLVESRRKARKEIIDILEKAIEGGLTLISEQELSYIHRIYENDNNSIPFLSYKKWVLVNELGDTPFLGQILKLEDYKHDTNLIKSFNKPIRKKTKSKDLVVNDYFPIEYIQIKNFKAIEDLKIEFKEDNIRKSWLVLLGENGVGKSSILQAIAIGLKVEKNLIKPLIPRLIKNGCKKSEIIIKERNNKNIIRTTIVREDATIYQEGSFSSSLIGYGSLRLSTEDVNEKQKLKIHNVSYENLFKPVKALNDITEWLKSIFKANPKLFNKIAYSIKQLLPHDFVDNQLTVVNDEIMFENSEKLFSELSDGYKSTIILAVDIMMKLSDGVSDMDKMTGIVLIDELGNQLHPRWQMRIVKQLRSVFPNINFIISTHHPLCLRGTEENEILLLKNMDDELVSTSELPDTSSMRVDQILSSEFFGLSSLIDPDLEALFNRYYELLSKEECLDLQSREELSDLTLKLKEKKHLGNSLRDELMYYAIDSILAKNVIYDKNPTDRNALKEEVRLKVIEEWNKLEKNDEKS